MSTIGDLFFRLRGDPKQLEVDVNKAGDKAGDSFGKRMSASFKRSWSGQNIGKGLVQGLGLAGGLGAVGLVTRAIGAVTDVLGDATKAAIAEEESIQRLGTSLRANVPNWNGETAGIESVLAARMKLGFSDDEQRESLARLVAVTHDVTEALDLERVAMDLARFKRISLAEASEALIKTEGGSFRVLKELIGSTKDIKTAEQALTAVRKVAAGQAEDYAETNGGKLLVSQVAMGEALEKLGEKTMPLVVEGTVAAAEAVTDLTDAMGGLDQAIKDVGGERGLGEILEALPFAGLGFKANRLANDMKASLADAEASTAGFASHAKNELAEVGASLDRSGPHFTNVGGKASTMASNVLRAVNNIKTWVHGLASSLATEARAMIKGYYDPLILKDNLRATNAEIAAQRDIIASKSSTKEQVADAKARLHQLGADQGEYLIQLAEAGMTGSKAYAAGIAQLKTQIAAAKGPAKAALQEILNKIREIEKVGKEVPINIQIASNVGGALGSALNNIFRAEGGPVQARMPYVVGERGPEIHVPSVSGRVLSTAQSIAAISGDSGGVTNYNLSTYGTPLYAPTPSEVVAQFRRAARIGAVTPVRRGPDWRKAS